MSSLRNTLTATTGAVLMCIALGWFGPVVLDNALRAQPTYTSYGYTPEVEASARAVADSQAADAAVCAQLHGPHAIAIELPDGQHRCADKHGRRLARSVITIAHKVTP